MRRDSPQGQAEYQNQPRPLRRGASVMRRDSSAGNRRAAAPKRVEDPLRIYK